jgi:tetratricopeptide (TPR) repeat protein
LAFAVATTATAHAQLDLIDRGGAEPFNQEMVSYRVGIYFQLRGEHERAIAEFTVTIDGLPHFGEAYAARGDSYTVLGEYEQAITDYNQAIRIYPDYVSALYMRGRALAAIGETDLAMADYANVIHQMPEYANAYWGLGDLYYAAGEYANALENYQIYLIMADDLNAQVTARVELLQTAA